MKSQNSPIEKIGEKVKQLPISRFLRFGVVGFSGLFVDIVVLFLLRERAGLPLYLSNNLAIEAAIINNFLWNDAWTFADVAQAQKGWRARLKRFAKFNVVCLVGAVLQNVILTIVLFIPIVGQLPSFAGSFITAEWTQNADEYFAKVTAIAIVTLWNFWINLKVSWRNPKN